MEENLLEFPEVKRWLDNRNPNTLRTYRSAFQAYLEFTKMTPKELIDEIEEDRNKPRREQGGPERRAGAFYYHLLNGYWLNQRTDGRGKTTKKGGSSSLASTYLGAIKGFYKANNYHLNYSVPKPVHKKVNKKKELKPEDIQRLINATDSLRDKAFIVTQFESLQSMEEVVGLNYGDIKEEFEAGIVPIKIDMIRDKANTEYNTFIGKDAIDLLRAYLKDRQMKGEELRYETPLFCNEGVYKYNDEGKVNRVSKDNITTIIRKAAILSGLVNEERLELADLSPVRSHAFRSSAGTLLQLAGVPKALVDFWQGHSIDAMDESYFIVENQRKIYAENYHHLSISLAKTDAKKLKQLEDKSLDLETNLSLKSQDIAKLVNSVNLLIENGTSKEKHIETLKSEVDSLTTRLEVIQRHQEDINRLFKGEWTKEQHEAFDVMWDTLQHIPLEEAREQAKVWFKEWPKAYALLQQLKEKITLTNT